MNSLSDPGPGFGGMPMMFWPPVPRPIETATDAFLVGDAANIGRMWLIYQGYIDFTLDTISGYNEKHDVWTLRFRQEVGAGYITLRIARGGVIDFVLAGKRPT